MNKPLKKIIGILVLIFFLPLLFFTVSEVTSLSENERVIENIYNNQLDAILFSVNQYTEDVVNSWASHINLVMAKGGSGASAEIEALLSENESIRYIFFAGDSGSNDMLVYSLDSTFAMNSSKESMKSFINDNRSVISRLKSYQESGYRKLQPIEDAPLDERDDRSSVLFVLNNEKAQGYSVCSIVINPVEFIRQTLAPRIQSVSQEKFYMTAYSKFSDEIIYTTDSELSDDSRQENELWLLPGYYLTIVLKSQTIKELVKERSYTNLFLILGIEAILLLALWLVYKNVVREIQLAQHKSDFVSNVSHEIRTPLALISMFAETLQMDRVKADEKKQEYYAIISQEANRLSGIVNKILNFSRMEADKMKYSFEQTDLNALVGELLHSYDYHLKSKGFEYSFEADEDIDNITIDKEAVKEAIINLLDNAVKYTEENKCIKLKTGQENKHIYIEVKDKGMGIPNENQKFIFDKFYRVTTGAVHNAKGTGLGLALVKNIMKVHKGNVTFESEPRKGSSFRLNFLIDSKINNLQ